MTIAEGDPARIREQIEITRAELGDTVAALAIKADVMAQARERVEVAKTQARGRVAEARQKVQANPKPFAAAGALLVGLVVLRIARR